MKLAVALLFLACTAALAEGWREAAPGWDYQFPRDHGNHPDFRTEWWYFTGNARDPADERNAFGFELVFFRHGLLPPGKAADAKSRFVVRDVKFAHFAVSDLRASRFHHTQRQSRGAFGEAGFSDGERLAWINPWECRLQPDGTFRIRAEEKDFAIDLRLTPAKPPIIHGENGLSIKGEGKGRASHYVSLTRMAAAGAIRSGAETFEVSGESWFDHEWASNQLAPDQVGWDWFSLQFDDNTELMLYRMRRSDGGTDPASSGTWIDASGKARHIKAGDILLDAQRTWTSPATKAKYPIAWKVRVPSLDLTLTVTTPLDHQELAVPPISYWEGAVKAEGTRGAVPVTGRGYLELTGYSGPLSPLQAR